MRNVIDIYSEVAEKMKELNSVEKSTIVFGLGGTYHRQRLQVLLEDLGSADSMYRQMYETSVNSAGSAMIENEKYMNSLQARINSTKVEFEKLAVSIGDAFLTSGIVEFLKIASTFLQSMSGIVSTVGVLPVLFGLASMAILTMSTRAKTLTGALNANAKSMKENMTATIGQSKSVNQSIVSSQRFTQSANTSSVATRRLSLSTTVASTASATMSNRLKTTANQMNMTTRATAMLATAGRTLASAFIWTAPFIAIGVLIEKITSARAETRELAESASSANKELLNSFKSNQEEVQKLVSQYENLENVINSGEYSNTQLAEYYKIQDKIASLMPSLVTGETEYGTKLVDTSNVIKSKVEMLKEQLSLEQEITEWQAKQDRDVRIDGNIQLAKDNMKSYREELTKLMSDIGVINQYNIGMGSGVKFDIPNLKSLDDVTSFLSKIADARKEAESNGNLKAIEYYDELSETVIDAQGSINGYLLSYKNAQSAQKVDYVSKINDSLKDNSELWGSNTDAISTFMGELLKLSDIDSVGNINDSLSSIVLNGSGQEEITNLITGFQRLNSATSENFDEIVQSVTTSMNLFKTALKYNSGLSDDEINALIDSLGVKLDTVKSNFEKVEEEMNRTGGTLDEVTSRVGMFSDGMSEMGDEVDTLSSKMLDFKDAIEQTAGVSQGGVDAVNDLIFQYDMLSNQLSNYTDEEILAAQTTDNLSSEQMLIKELLSQRVGVMQQLSSVYPNLLGFDGKAIELSEQKREAMEKENKANQVLLEAYKLAREGKLNAEQTMTLTAAKGSKNRIEILKQELLALDAVFQKYREEASKLTATSTSDVADKQLMSTIADRTTLTSELNKELDNLADFSVTIDDFVTKINDSTSSTKSADKAKKESNSTTKESIYLSDEYKKSLEKLNLEIERQQAIQATQPEHSEAYRKSLEAQLKLEREKRNLIQSQSASLDKQIESGKIAQTGKITLEDNTASKSDLKTTTTKSATNRKLNGWGGRITDTYGTYRAIRNGRMHTGVDVAGATGTRLDANVSGKVVKAGYSKLSGNHVQILDDKGMKHFYGHLDKIVAQLGDVVEVGTHIGNIGNTGNSSGSHLHYEIKNAQGKNFDPMEYVKAAKQSQTIVQSVSQNVSSVVSTTEQSIDDAKSTLLGLQSDVLKSQEAIAKLEQAIIESQLSAFDFKRDEYDSIMSFEEAKLANVEAGTTRYTKTLEKQQRLIKAKQRVNNEELAYIDGLIKSGKLSAITLEQMKSRTMELKTSMESLNAELGQLALDKLDAIFNPYQQKQDDVIDFEKNKLAELDVNSSRYVATLEKINKHLNRKVITTKEHIASIEKEIKVSNLQGVALENARRQIQELTLDMQSLNTEMMDTNFEIVVNTKVKHDEKVDDLQFEIDRSKVIQSFHEEGSYDYIAETQKQIQLYSVMADEHDKSRRGLQAELKLYEMFPEKIKEITEMLEDETMAYWNAKKAVDELTTSVEESNQKMLEDIGNKAVDAYKDAMQEMQDEHMRRIDKQVEAEEKAHEKRMKQLEDEMELYRKSVEEKLELIDKQEADRDFNMEMDELTTERSKVQAKYDGLLMDDTHEAKSKRKKLQEELDEIDKNINEKRHDRNIDLQKENLNNLLEDKEVEIEKREELEESRHEKVITEIEREREYWTKHYTDLLNDERKFAQLRKDIIAGNMDKVQVEFNRYIRDLEATMPELVDTLDGTMKEVGTSIRQNVIDNLRLAMDEFNKLNNMSATPSSTPIKDPFDPNASKDTTYSGNTSSENINSNMSKGNKAVYESLSNEDYRVMLGKYINDEIAPQYKAMTDDRIKLKEEGNRVAKLGRDNGSIIPKESAFDVELKNFSDEQIERLKSFINNNASILGGKYKSKMTSGIASLDTGGMLNFGSKTGGVDGKGGKYIIGHDEEIMLNPLETQEMLKTSSILNSAIKMITPLLSKLPKLNLPTMSSVTGDTFNFNFNVDEMIANKHEADNFATQTINAFKTKKGVRF